MLEGADEAAAVEYESGLGGMAGLLLFNKVVGKRIAECGRPDDTCKKNKNVQYY